MIAEVIVDISNQQVDKIFDYYFDDQNVVPGLRVLVPFGNRKIEGFVINIKKTSDYQSDKIKKIFDVLDDEPVIKPELLKLQEFLSEQYKLKIVDLLRLFIPSQMRQGKVKPLKLKFLTLNSSFDETTVKFTSQGQKDLFFYMQEKQTQKQSELTKLFSASSINSLKNKGVLLESIERCNRTPYKQLITGEKTFWKLVPSQQNAYKAIMSDSLKTYLLHGVTGSGKTEVYINCILDVITQGKSAILLVPEISLTPQVLKIFRERFGDKVAILHSGLSAGERFDEWDRLRTGEAMIAVGARSAIFAPLDNIGIIIIDEEHDSSYISETNPRYNTLEIAHFRAKYNECALVLGSATPQIESYYFAKNNKYQLLNMNERINLRKLPQIDVVDMSRELKMGNKSFFSRKLQQSLKNCLEKQQQAIIFLNRRGFASYQQCRACGYVVKCPDCDVSMVYHREENKLKCHYCLQRNEVLEVCPDCGSQSIKQGSVGTERIVYELQQLYQNARILRMDNDTTTKKDSHQQILQSFSNREADILVGTQMIAKGHDFPNVTLVGIVEADMSLYVSDYRACERTFQLITQVAGRAGRAELTGEVVLQTYNPKHYVYKFAVNSDYQSFFEKECNIREVTKFPPFSTIFRIVVSSEVENNAIASLKKIFDSLQVLSQQHPNTFLYLKAMKSPIKKIQSKYRMQIIIRTASDKQFEITNKIFTIVSEYNKTSETLANVEINPQNLS